MTRRVGLAALACLLVTACATTRVAQSPNAPTWNLTGCDPNSIVYPFENGRGELKFPEGSCPPPPGMAISCSSGERVRPVKAESQSHETYYTHIADYAIDEHLVTRWSAGSYVDEQWFQVDLGKARSVREVILTWELAHAKKYLIQVSNDKENWRTVAAVKDGDGFVDRVRTDGRGRYVRMQSLEKANEYGISLFDFAICAAPEE